MAITLETTLIRDSDRTAIYMTGSASTSLRTAMRRRGLVLHDRINAKAVSVSFPADCRAILLGFNEPRLREAVLDLYAVTLNHGGFLGIVILRELDRVGATAVFNSIPDRYAGPMEATVDPRVLDGTDSDGIAQACFTHSPGPAPDHRLAVASSSGLTLNQTETTLIRRALEGYSRIELVLLGGGYTNSRLLRVDGIRHDGEACAPYVLKIANRKDINQELDQIRDYVLDTVPFPNHPPIVEASCVAGATKRVMVSRLVDMAWRFDEFIANARSDKAVESAIELLFSGPLRIWRSQVTQEDRELADWYIKQGVIPDNLTRISHPARLARKADNKVGKPKALVKRITKYPPVTVTLCLAHGDLHVRNIFARYHPATNTLIDVVLIDFASTRKQSPTARDLATLEVSVALDNLPHARDLTTNQLNRWFTGAILEKQLKVTNRRLRALEAIRKQARDEQIDPLEYKISLVAYFLRYAKFKTQPMPKRALAYSLAWKLSEEVEASF